MRARRILDAARSRRPLSEVRDFLELERRRDLERAQKIREEMDRELDELVGRALAPIERRPWERTRHALRFLWLLARPWRWRRP